MLPDRNAFSKPFMIVCSVLEKLSLIALAPQCSDNSKFRQTGSASNLDTFKSLENAVLAPHLSPATGGIKPVISRLPTDRLYSVPGVRPPVRPAERSIEFIAKQQSCESFSPASTVVEISRSCSVFSFSSN